MSRNQLLRSRTPHLKVMVLEKNDEGKCLPRALSRGIAYAAAVGDLGFLVERNVLSVADEEKAHINTADANDLFLARCNDQKTLLTSATEKMKLMRFDRFHEVLCTNCKGRLFSLRQLGMGELSSISLYKILRQNNYYTIVDLSGNPLGDQGALQISNILRENTTIVVLQILSVDMGAEGVVSIADALLQNNTLTYLDMSGLSGIHRNHFGLRGCMAMATAIQKNKVLSTLKLGSCGFDRVGLISMIEEFSKNKIITDLSLASNQFSPQACEAFFHALHINNNCLTTLDMSRTKVGDIGLSSLGVSLGAHQTLTTVILSRCNLHCLGLMHVAQFLMATNTIEYLDLEGNPLCDGDDPETDDRVITIQGIGELSNALVRGGCPLKTIIMSHCGLPPVSGSKIGEFLARSESLTKIDISHNYLSDEGVTTFANAMEQNQVLKAFYVDHNHVTSKGWLPIFSSLRYNATLTHIRIAQGGTPIRVEDTLDVLRTNHTLQYLDFSTQADVVNALSRNKWEWDKGTSTRLESKISVLLKDEHELYATQDLILEEQRKKDRINAAIKDLRDKGKIIGSNRKQEFKELEERWNRIKEESAALKTEYDEKCIDWDMKLKTMEDKVTFIQGMIDSEVAKREQREKEKEASRPKLTRRRSISVSKMPATNDKLENSFREESLEMLQDLEKTKEEALEIQRLCVEEEARLAKILEFIQNQNASTSSERDVSVDENSTLLETTTGGEM